MGQYQSGVRSSILELLLLATPENSLLSNTEQVQLKIPKTIRVSKCLGLGPHS